MKGDVALVVRRTVRAPIERVYEAWTHPDHLRRWWGPRPVTCATVELDVRVGGAYRIANLLVDGTTLWILGRFEIVEPPRRLAFTWMTERDGVASTERSFVTVRFAPHDDGTEVVVVHERVAAEETRRSHALGWRGCLENLEALFAAG